ncbi:MAG: hypothetical protein JF887_08095 [Candidatus Dormibacteraeota bacterium]|uniref:HTH marR-type domain-containing protein n=1 Tax=Candidatus Amunia macphersoniae TaxID=3127014 RepID=A0A934KM70_9BACT|nr:hypothetical protein [Candidatus Dormibacteraeota bacterium]
MKLPSPDQLPTALTTEEHQLWQSLRAVILVGLPEVERGFRRFGLVQLDYDMLVRLFTHPAGLRLSDLAASLKVSPSRLSHRLEKLAGSAVMTLETSESDGRVTIARITATGRVLVERLALRHEADLRRLLLAPLRADQKTALADALSTIAAHLPTESAVELQGSPRRRSLLNKESPVGGDPRERVDSQE